jgi:KaiC/GvpD/RAD55 family RecA-like ATPase
VQYLEPVDDITLDYVAEKIVRTAAYLDERRTAQKYVDTLDKTKDVVKARTWVKTRWQDSITMIERRVHEGSCQDNAEDVYERYRKMIEGQTPEEAAKSLRFLSGFPTIDEAINSDLERCFALAGPPNNFKTSVLLSVVNNLGRQGKAVLLVTGEHDPDVLEEYMALLAGYHMRDQLPLSLPPHKLWRDGMATKEHLAALRFVIDDMKELRSCPGPIVVKHINDFHNDLDEIVQYMENTHSKYEWKAVVIDPFDTLLLNTDSQKRFFKGTELIQRLFDLKTSYHGGDGLIVMTSLQMKKNVKGEVEKLQHMPDSTLADFRDVLDASEIDTFSAAVQKLDMIWGVAARNDSMTQGVLVCSRVRFGNPFEPFWFRVDAASHCCYEQRRATPVAQIEMDDCYRGEFE